MKSPLILVVGPSGAGKDALMRESLPLLGPSFMVARRAVTRSAVATVEDHDSLSEAEFAAREASGGFLLSWRAHGLAYGLPAEVDSWRCDGLTVIANASRTVVNRARADLPPVGVIVVTASPDVLAARLAGRGREQGEAVAGRLVRAVETPSGHDVRVVVNDGTLSQGIERFVVAVRDLVGT